MSGFEGSDIRTMVMFGQGEDATPWVEVSTPEDVTRFVLFPAARYGQLLTLRKFIDKGDPWLLDTDPGHIGWNLYHYAVQGYQMNCNYLISSTSELNPNLPSTFEQARETQLDILHALAKGKAMPFDPRNPALDNRPVNHPPHPSQMALDPDYNFLEAAYLIDILVILNSDPDSVVPTPGLEIIKVSNKKEYTTALCHLMKWSYDRSYLDVLGYCHDRYYSICGDILRMEPGNLPMFLHAVTVSNLGVIKLVFDHVEKRPVPDRLMSRVYTIGSRDQQRKANAVSLACESTLLGNAPILHNLIADQDISKHLANISLSDLQLTEVPIALFHERLNSLTLSGNHLATLPPVSEWMCKSLLFLSLEQNRFQQLPVGLFSLLPKLQMLNVSNNQLNQLEPSLWRARSLKNLHLNRNRLKALPCPSLPKLSVSSLEGDVPSTHTTSKTVDHIFNIGHSFVTHGGQHLEDQQRSGEGHSLQWLDLSDNELDRIPEGLACLCPQLRTLKLSRNQIVDFGCVTEYPSALKSLELIRNIAQFSIHGHSGPGSGNAVRCYQSQPGNLINCYHRTHSALVSLQHLNVNKNKLQTMVLEDSQSLKSPKRQSSIGSQPVRLLFPSLQSLSLAHNNLAQVPDGIHKQTGLLNLDISHNEHITQLPLKIYHLKDLDGFQYKGISDPIIQQLDNCKDLGHMRHFLRAKETETITNLRMRVNIIGHHKKGKSTVLRHIHKYATRSREFFTSSVTSSLSPGDQPGFRGMTAETWEYTRKKLPSGQHVSFNVWEFGGKDEYFPVHQCFLSNRALYVLVWRATDREAGIQSLGIWLRSLQTKAPGSQVIIVGTHIDQIPANERTLALKNFHQTITDMYGSNLSRDFPVIRKVHFVSLEESTRFTFFSASEYEKLAETIFDEAERMEIPKTKDMKPNFHMRLLEEQLPRTYLELEVFVNRLTSRGCRIIQRKKFCELPEVKCIIEEPSEVDTAMDTLHDRGTVFHFQIKTLEDYYILDTQWWFDACELVVCPDNVRSLLATADSSSGILNYDNMDALFKEKGVEEHTSLVFQFLHQHEVILPVDAMSALVPSFLYHAPTFKLTIPRGVFPHADGVIEDKPLSSRHEFGKFVAAAAYRSLPSAVKINRTGLVLRRMFLLPPIGMDFWNRIINLCLQKHDFADIISEAFEKGTSIITSDHGQFYQIGNGGVCQMRWKYWTSGIVLDLNNQIILSINNIKSDDFIDPTQLSETSLKVNRFNFFDKDDGFLSLSDAYSELFEVTVLDVQIETGNPGSHAVPISAKLLAKCLEMIDEVLRGYSNDLAEDGIYTLSQLCHVVPCPLCFGDKDNRSHSRTRETNPIKLGSVARRAYQSLRTTRMSGKEQIDSSQEEIVVFSLDQLIDVVTDGSDYIECPRHKGIRLKYLSPDIYFDDLPDLKLRVSQLNNPPGNDGTPVGQGCFGKVYHKLLNDAYNDNTEVAVKEFIVDAMMGNNEEMDEVKKYSDMRYEINKLSILNHDYIVKFVGVISRPPSFVLEWATLMSLEKIRANHERHHRPICPVSLYITLLQVLDGLHYLHAPPVGIIHSDLKLSNILAFRYTEVDHICCKDVEDKGRCVKALPEYAECGILVKLGDMGVCINPTGHDAGDNLGVKRFAPECNTPTAKKLTEKVDIFCLGICMYELLSLRGLPPEDYTEIEYRKMIARGWRPLFHSRDVSYPLVLKLLLEQCWEQDYTRRPSAKVLRTFLEGVTGIKVASKFEVPPVQLSMKHCLDGFMFESDNQEVTAIQMVSTPPGDPLMIYMALCEEDSNTVVAMKSVQDVESKKTFFKSTVINQAAEEKVIAIHVTPSQDVVLGYPSGRVIYVKAKGGFPQSTSGNLCNVELHGRMNFIQYIQEEELIITGFSNGTAHVMKVQAQQFTDMFLKGFYCCKKESPELTAMGCYAVVYKRRESQLEIWCGCSNSKIETWNFSLATIPKWRQSLTVKTTTEINLRHQSYTSHLTAVTDLSLTPEEDLVFALLGDTTKYGTVAICQISASTKAVLRHWQCNMEKVSYFNATTTDLVVGTSNGFIFVYSRKVMEESEEVKANYVARVQSHSGDVHQAAVYDGVITTDGYSSMFHTYLGPQGQQDTPCRYIVSIGKGFINPRQFYEKAPKNSGSQRSGTCFNIWAV